MSGLSFDQLASQPEHWFRLASQLFCAAETCLNAVPAMIRQPRKHADDWDKPLGHKDGGMLMLAFAVENAFKGLAIERGVFHRLENGELSWQGKWGKHDLVSMADDLALPQDADEKEILARLTIAGLWSGRYPIPQKALFYQSERSSQHFRLSDIELAQRLIARCKALAGFDPVTGWPRRN